MSHFLTQCPFCQTSFRISENQMRAANGVVRCGACREVFLAGQHRIFLKEKTAATEQPAPAVRPPEPAEPDAAAYDPDAHFWPAEEEVSAMQAEEQDILSWDEPEFSPAGDGVTIDVGADVEDDFLDDDLFFPWDDGGEGVPRDPGLPDQDDLHAEAEFPADAPAPPEDQPDTPEAWTAAWAGRLNPAGYHVTRIAVDCVLPPRDYLEDAATAANEAQADAPEDSGDAGIADDAATPDPYPGWNHAALAAQHPPRAAAVVTPVPVQAPVLVPDKVASEALPTSGLGAQTLAWFRSFREGRSQETPEPVAVDEKQRLRSSLSGLKHEDSLEPVAQENLAVLAEAPVELVAVNDPYRKWKFAGLILLALLLGGALGGQYLWFNLESLVREQRFAAITEPLCRYLTCPDNEVIDLTTLVTEELVVRSHPTADDALLVNFIFRNDAAREQPFPDVELNFTDNGGRVVANRVFTAADYLPEQMLLFTYMPAHSSLQISLELVDPGADATGYNLTFRNPRP